MQQRLDQLYPHVSNALGAYLMGDDSFEFEIDEIVATEGPERSGVILAELRRLLADPNVGDDELTTFVTTTSPWLVQTGRITLQQVADRLEQTIARSARSS